ncbi:MAG: hypothetical protein ABII16_00155 [Patescibacteria group bacterium]|nr:hypothetical protein [Patescibacteria group bacterium]
MQTEFTEKMQITSLFEDFNNLQLLYGGSDLDAIYGCGKIESPKTCLVFMNPTARNVSSDKNWTGIKAPWLGTKNVWNMLYYLGVFDKKLVAEINAKKPKDWDYKFSEYVYKVISDNSLYITNLSKATQKDARALPNGVFKEYLELFKKEIVCIKPKLIVSFGNQVSSILLNKNIKVSEYRKRHEPLVINGVPYKIFPVYYPVGQGMRNIQMVQEDIFWILKNAF